jgi:endo-1,4-beta-xylanase
MNRIKIFIFIGVFFCAACGTSQTTTKKKKNKNKQTEAATTDASKSVDLYKAYLNYFPIGTAISPEADLSSEERKQFIAQQYNSVTAENQMKTRFIHPQKNKWNWAPADAIVSFAKANNMKVRGHALVWYQNVPNWFIKDNSGNLLSKDQFYTNMKEHIETMMKHYPSNDVYCWDVVNEAISDAKNEEFRPKDSLFAISGEEYVEMAFRYARAADPKAQLYYNDYRFTDSTKRRKIYNLLKRLKAKGTPIDGVGMQSHYTPNEVTSAYLQETIDMFVGLGLKVQVTELDVSVYNYRDKNSADSDKADDAYTDARKLEQEKFYKMLFEVYRKNKNHITGVTFWGASDLRKNFRTNKIGKMDYPFLFDEFMKPKQVVNTITKF